MQFSSFFFSRILIDYIVIMKYKDENQTCAAIINRQEIS